MFVSLLALAASLTSGMRPEKVKSMELNEQGDPPQAIDGMDVMEGVLLGVGNATEHTPDADTAPQTTGSTPQRLHSLGFHALSPHADPRQSIDDVKAVMEGVLLDAGNATEHMSDDEKALLNSVIDVIESTIYASMDSSHTADEAALANAVAAAAACNADFTGRIAPGGDLGQLRASVVGLQDELNLLRGEVDSKTATERTEWTRLSNHMAALSDAPSCSPVPDRTKASLHAYFEQSAFATWYAGQQEEWASIEDAYDAAEEALKHAEESYALGLAKRDTGYCFWKAELDSGCTSFDECFQGKSSSYVDTVTPAVVESMNARIEAFKAGEVVVAQIKFLLGLSADSTLPEVNTSRYELDFPTLPSQVSCNLEEDLGDPIFFPSVVCATSGKVAGKKMGPVGALTAVSGCPSDGSSCTGWFSIGCGGSRSDACDNGHVYSPAVTTLPRSERSDHRWWTGGGCSSGTCADVWMVAGLASPSGVISINFLNYQCPYGAKVLEVSASDSVAGPFSDARVFDGLGCGQTPGKYSGRAAVLNHGYWVPDEDLIFDPPLFGQYIKIEIKENHGSGGTGYYRLKFSGSPLA